MLQQIRDRVQGDVGLSGLSYTEIASELNRRPLTLNPVTVAPQVPDLPTFEQLTFLATGDEWAAIDSIDKVNEWARTRIDSDEIIDPSSSQTKSLLRAIAAAAPEQWEGSMFDLIGYGLESILDTDTYPRINGQLIVPDATPDDPNPQPRSILNAIGVILIEQNVLSSATFQAMATRLAQAKDDPNWTPQVEGQSWAEENGFGTIGASDVQRALEG